MSSEERNKRLREWWDSAAVLADEAERLGVVPHLAATLQRRCRTHTNPDSSAHYRGWCAECGWVRGGDPFADLLVPTPPAEQRPQPIGTVRGTPAPSPETAYAILQAMRRIVTDVTLPMRDGRLTVEAWWNVAGELHRERVDAQWHDDRPDELRIYEHRRPVARIVYDQMRYRLNLEALELDR